MVQPGCAKILNEYHTIYLIHTNIYIATNCYTLQVNEMIYLLWFEVCKHQKILTN